MAVGELNLGSSASLNVWPKRESGCHSSFITGWPHHSGCCYTDFAVSPGIAMSKVETSSTRFRGCRPLSSWLSAGGSSNSTRRRGSAGSREDARAGKLDALAEAALKRPQSREEHGPLRHYASPAFWNCYRQLPNPVRELADKASPCSRPILITPHCDLKKVGRFWSARVGLYYRALGVEGTGRRALVLIGSHADYDKLVS